MLQQSQAARPGVAQLRGVGATLSAWRTEFLKQFEWAIWLHGFAADQLVHSPLSISRRDRDVRAIQFLAPPGDGHALYTSLENDTGPNAPTSVVLTTWLCPSDGRGGSTNRLPYLTTTGPLFARGNYLAFFGNIDAGSAWPPRPPSHQPHLFGFNRSVRVAEILDGASHTLALGEVLTGTGSDFDYRGVFWYDHVGAGQIFTKCVPNSPIADVLYPVWCETALDINQPAMNLPCVPGSSDGSDNTAAARSSHAGGVQVALSDGSVQFVADTIDLAVWQAAGSIAGNELTSGF